MLTAKDVILGLIAIFLLALIFGCAQTPDRGGLPVCDKFEAQLALDAGGNPHVCLDMGNAEKLRALILGVSQGTCRLPE